MVVWKKVPYTSSHSWLTFLNSVDNLYLWEATIVWKKVSTLRLTLTYLAMFRIRDILWTDPDFYILTLDYWSGFVSDSGSFCFGRSTFTSVFKVKNKKSLRSRRTVEIIVYLNFFLLLWKDPDSWDPKTYRTVPAPDPEYWYLDCNPSLPDLATFVFYFEVEVGVVVSSNSMEAAPTLSNRRRVTFNQLGKTEKIARHFGSLSVLSGPCQSFLVLVSPFGSLSVLSGPCQSFLVLVSPFWSLSVLTGPCQYFRVLVSPFWSLSVLSGPCQSFLVLVSLSGPCRSFLVLVSPF